MLRYNPDGTIPSDNPFGRTNPVWAYGLRNPFGIAFSTTGQLAITMNGPSGDAGSPGTGYDTLYLNVARGAHFQWPDCYGYSHPLAASTCGGGIAPNWSSEASTYVPTGATFVDASWAGRVRRTPGVLHVRPGDGHRHRGQSARDSTSRAVRLPFRRR